MEKIITLSDVSKSKKNAFACVYLLVFPNGKKYVGSTCNYGRRMSEHKEFRSGGSNVKSAIKQFGADNIKVFILDINLVKNNQFEKEQFWLNVFNPFNDEGYNICPIAGTRKNSKMSKLFSINQSIRVSGEGNPMFGKKNSEESKLKMRQSAKSRMIKINQYGVDGEYINQFESLHEAARSVGGFKHHIKDVALGNNNRKTYKGFVWRYAS